MTGCRRFLSQLNQLKAKPEDEDINLKFLRALPSSWSQVSFNRENQGGLELLLLDDFCSKAILHLRLVPPGSTRRRSDVTQCPSKKVTFAENCSGQREGNEKQRNPHSKIRKIGKKEKIPKPDHFDTIKVPKMYQLITGADTKEASTTICTQVTSLQRPSPVHAGRRNSSSVTSGWWQSTARPMAHLPTPTSSYFQTYTPFGPHVYYNQMQYGGLRWATAVKPSAGCSWKTHRKGLYWENPYSDAEDEGIFDSGCSRSMTGNMERLDDFQEFQGGKVTFGGGEGRITGKGTIRTPTLDFENVYYVKELQQFNLFSISQICDKKNRVLFTDTDCLVLSKDFMLPDESMVLLRVPRKHNLYTINLNNLSPRGNLACLVAKASVDESVKWHRRMGHVNYKNMNT
ncbi:hypothetical protein Tco_0271557 [Tanacetum coccineum]